MSSMLLTGPAAEPLLLADAKAFLRVDNSDDDDVITALIAAARAHVEAQTRRALITQTWRLIRDHWPPDGRLAVLPAPLRAITAARVYDADGVTHSVDTQAFTADIAAAPAIVSFVPWSMPEPGRCSAGIELDVQVGYGDAATDVPVPLRQAIKLLVSHWYENRGLVALADTIVVLPQTIAALIAPYRVLSL
jgi:uncharacterized phiE125 gp8 family phage protein